MASQQPGITVTSGGVMQRKTVEEMLQEVSKRIQNFGPGPRTPEQAQELEKLKLIYAKLIKSQGEVIVTTQNPASNLAQASMAGQKIPGQTVTTQQAVQRIVPAVSSNQGTPASAPGMPVTTTVTILPQGSTIPTKIQVSSSTNLTSEQIQQIQAQVLSQAQAQGQPQTVQISSPLTVAGTSAAATQQQQVVQGQVKVATPVTGQTLLAPGQRVGTASPTPVGVTSAGIKSTQVVAQPGLKTATQPVTTQQVPIQRHLIPNKVQGSVAISTTQSNTSGVIPNIAPSSTVSVPKSLVSHGGIQNRVETASPQPQQPLTKRRLQELLHEIDPQEQMDDDVEDLLLQIADDFIENVVNASCQIAKHRKSNTLEVKDVQLHLERCWNMWIPGFGADELRPYKKAATTEAHKQRLALIRKSLKK